MASSLGISDRVEVMSKSDSYVNLKDHKPDFENHPTYRLLNPNKCNMGKVSKEILQSVNEKLKNITKFNQWKNSYEVIQWFNEIEDKDRSSFIQYDIEKFYPSINEDLLTNALEWALQYVKISNQEGHIIM